MRLPNDHIHARHDRVVNHRSEGYSQADLYVLLMVYNPVRYRSRWKLAQDTFKRVRESGAKLAVVEVAHGHRDFVLGEGPTQFDFYLQLETESELWLKEAGQNLIVPKLPLDCQYIACIDADISFARDDWANETVQQLQHYDVVQMWSQATDLGPDHTMIMRHHSFIYSWLHNEAVPPSPGYYGHGPGPKGPHMWHPGFAWAYRRKAFSDLGRLLTVGILGAGDNHMAKALVGNAGHSIHPDMHGAYRREVLEWQNRAQTHLVNGIGLVEGELIHYWHGPKVNRKYWDRWKILTEHQFNPDTDLKYDWQGLPTLVIDNPRQRAMRDKIREYFRQRNEDATTE